MINVIMIQFSITVYYIVVCKNKNLHWETFETIEGTRQQHVLYLMTSFHSDSPANIG